VLYHRCFQIPDFASIPIVKRFMRGVFQLRPSLPRYKSVWNVHSVFNFIRNQQRVEDLSLKTITIRLIFHLCLLSGQRRQTIQVLRLDQMNAISNAYTSKIVDKLKQTRPRYHKNLFYTKSMFQSLLCVDTLM